MAQQHDSQAEDLLKRLESHRQYLESNTPRGTPTDNVTNATLTLLEAVILLLKEHKDS